MVCSKPCLADGNVLLVRKHTQNREDDHSTVNACQAITERHNDGVAEINIRGFITSTQSAPVDIITERIVTGERNGATHADASRVEDLRSGIAPHFRLRQARPVGVKEEANTVGGTLLRHAVREQRRQYQVGKG